MIIHEAARGSLDWGMAHENALQIPYGVSAQCHVHTSFKQQQPCTIEQNIMPNRRQECVRLCVSMEHS
jgi:hypothetical protein